jgi:hypothetical protein
VSDPSIDFKPGPANPLLNLAALVIVILVCVAVGVGLLGTLGIVAAYLAGWAAGFSSLAVYIKVPR